MEIGALSGAEAVEAFIREVRIPEEVSDGKR
jgi:hypothetical protein